MIVNGPLSEPVKVRWRGRMSDPETLFWHILRDLGSVSTAHKAIWTNLVSQVTSQNEFMRHISNAMSSNYTPEMCNYR